MYCTTELLVKVGGWWKLSCMQLTGCVWLFEAFIVKRFVSLVCGVCGIKELKLEVIPNWLYRCNRDLFHREVDDNCLCGCCYWEKVTDVEKKLRRGKKGFLGQSSSNDETVRVWPSAVRILSLGCKQQIEERLQKQDHHMRKVGREETDTRVYQRILRY